MAYTFAGQYGPEPIVDSLGRPLPSVNVQIFQSGTLATLYTDRTMATTAVNPTTSDVTGNVTFYAAPGRYQLVPAGGLYRQVVVLPDQADDLTDGTTATSANAGSNGAVPAQVVGYLVINIAGTQYKVPYFAN